MKVVDIKPKYLVFGQLFDDFSNATDKINFDEEDLCSYVDSLSSTFYWLNTESIWGPIGFQWTSYDNKTKKGYGLFNTTTIPFTVIPRIPDSYRHTSLIGIFNNLS